MAVKAKKKSLFEGMPTTTIKLPVTRNDKEDKWVAVNGKSMQIKRGVPVEVPVCIAEVLQRQEEMLMEAMEYEASATGKAYDEALE